MLTPFVCISVHFAKLQALNRFNGSSQSHGVIMGFFFFVFCFVEIL